MAAHPLWGEKPGAAVRTGHATTTLLRAGKRVIVVDPSLPGPIMAAKLGERANVRPEDVTHVFLTCFKPDVRRGITLFENATWWISEAEREQVGVALVRRVQQADEEGDEELKGALKDDVAMLKRCEAAPDRLAEGADLFPMHGVTPGMCGIIVAEPVEGLGTGTTLICGDAVPTLEHLVRGVVMHGAADVEGAQESLREAVEIADVLVLGRDNWVINPLRRGYA